MLFGGVEFSIYHFKKWVKVQVDNCHFHTCQTVVSLVCTCHHFLPAAVTSNLSPPQVVSARLEVRLEGSNSKPGPLQAMALIATVGQARLCVPKSLEVCILA